MTTYSTPESEGANPGVDESTTVRVCCRCGTPASGHAFCLTCGLNLHIQPELPTAAEYAARLREQQWLRTSAPPPVASLAPPHAGGLVSRKEPGLAILFSFFFAGAGELYAGDSGTKTIVFLVLAGVAWVCALTLILIPIALLLLPVFIYSMVNASNLTKAYNARHGLA
jgi:TM2 domain-containing membrane protein YozV